MWKSKVEPVLYNNPYSECGSKRLLMSSQGFVVLKVTLCHLVLIVSALGLNNNDSGIVLNMKFPPDDRGRMFRVCQHDFAANAL